MTTGSIVEDERVKMLLPQACSYCGRPDNLSVDHLLPKNRGGPDSGDNIVWACRHCNSAKGGSDLLVWMGDNGRFPPLLLLRRYLKLAIEFSQRNSVMDLTLTDHHSQAIAFPFAVDAIPHRFPAPSQLVLWIVSLTPR